MSVIYDKLSFMRRLEGEGLFSRTQAEALTEAVHGALSETVCTKADLAALKSELKGEIVGARGEAAQARTDLSRDIAQVRADLGHDITQVRADLGHDIAQVRTEMTLIRADLKLWMGSMAAALFASLGGLMTVFKFLVH